jgi:hypothetical protein
MPPKFDHRASKALVARGKRDIVQHESAGVKKTGQKPSTSKALILRDAKYGGGVVLFKSRIFGQEKLDLLAGNEVQILCSLL